MNREEQTDIERLISTRLQANNDMLCEALGEESGQLPEACTSAPRPRGGEACRDRAAQQRASGRG
jgi:hypothetical protein